MNTEHESDAPPKLTCDELIRTEMQGKFLAIERYDSMLWKIRTGYIVVLYGALTIIGGTSELVATSGSGNIRTLVLLLVLIWGFSLCGLVSDFRFLQAKFRVVDDSNELHDLALNLALDKTRAEAEYDKLMDLLHISGEKTERERGPQFFYAFWSVAWIYLTTPLLGTAIILYLWSFTALTVLVVLIAAIAAITYLGYFHGQQLKARWRQTIESSSRILNE
jgi:hypothetical protein